MKIQKVLYNKMDFKNAVYKIVATLVQPECDDWAYMQNISKLIK